MNLNRWKLQDCVQLTADYKVIVQHSFYLIMKLSNLSKAGVTGIFTELTLALFVGCSQAVQCEESKWPRAFFQNLMLLYINKWSFFISKSEYYSCHEESFPVKTFNQHLVSFVKIQFNIIFQFNPMPNLHVPIKFLKT